MSIFQYLWVLGRKNLIMHTRLRTAAQFVTVYEPWKGYTVNLICTSATTPRDNSFWSPFQGFNWTCCANFLSHILLQWWMLILNKKYKQWHSDFSTTGLRAWPASQTEHFFDPTHWMNWQVAPRPGKRWIKAILIHKTLKATPVESNYKNMKLKMSITGAL